MLSFGFESDDQRRHHGVCFAFGAAARGVLDDRRQLADCSLLRCNNCESAEVISHQNNRMTGFHPEPMFGECHQVMALLTEYMWGKPDAWVISKPEACQTIYP
jgi:hypothetical protein